MKLLLKTTVFFCVLPVLYRAGVNFLLGTR